MEMTYRNFVETWLNDEPRQNKKQFEDDIIKLLKFYGIEFDESGFIIHPNKNS